MSNKLTLVQAESFRVRKTTSGKHETVGCKCTLTTIKTTIETKMKLKTCKNGHNFYKKSDCPSCPICEEKRKHHDNFLFQLVAPARRALERENIKTLTDLSQYSEKEILSMHGMGKSTLPKLQEMLTNEGLSFKKQQ